MKTQKYVATWLMALVCGVVSFPGMAHAEFVIVVSSRSPVTALTSEQAAQVFLGKVSVFPNGDQAIPLDQPEGAAIRNEFYDKLTNKTPKQVLAYRANMVFSGKGRPPKELPSSKDVKKIVADNLNTIGYMEKASVDDTLRVVFAQP